MKRILLSAALLVFAVSMVSAEKVIDRKGDMYFKALCYPRAFTEYMKDYQRTPGDTVLLRKITETILNDENPRDTAIFFIEKYLARTTNDTEAYYMAAQAHYHAHHFDKARKYLSEYESRLTGKDVESQRKKASKLSSWIDNAQRMMRDTLKCKLYNLGDMINTVHSEINPYISADDKTLFFSSDEKFNSNDIIMYFNVKFSENSDLSWTKSKAVSGYVNTLYDEYVAGLTKDGIFFSTNSTTEFSLNEASYLGNGRFGEGLKMLEPIDGKGDECAATYSLTGDTIIFSGTNKNGTLSLYYSIRRNDAWGPVRLLPGQVNTENSDENYPNLSRDGKRLYFCSNREGSMGGYDIYYSDLDKKTGEWGAPVQMKYPINDTYDNMTISFSSNGRYAYISSIRKEGMGSRDIYAVIFDDVMPTSAILKCFVGIKAQQRPKMLTEQPLIEVTDESGERVASAKLNINTSTFILALDPGTYTISIDADGAKPFETSITIREKVHEDKAIEQVFILDPEE